jgi:hypothetical protein
MGFDRKCGRPLGATKSLGWSPFRFTPDIGIIACLEVKMIGKPHAEKSYVRFDAAEQVSV